jgi:hypothetical protein
MSLKMRRRAPIVGPKARRGQELSSVLLFTLFSAIAGIASPARADDAGPQDGSASDAALQDGSAQEAGPQDGSAAAHSADAAAATAPAVHFDAGDGLTPLSELPTWSENGFDQDGFSCSAARPARGPLSSWAMTTVLVACIALGRRAARAPRNGGVPR